MYATGEGMHQDNVAAYAWFDLAAGQGVDNADANRDTIALLMTTSEIEEAGRLTREWGAAGQ
jgi:TPR repeat protein